MSKTFPVNTDTGHAGRTNDRRDVCLLSVDLCFARVEYYKPRLILFSLILKRVYRTTFALVLKSRVLISNVSCQRYHSFIF